MAQKHKMILVIEDEAEISNLVSRILKIEGYSIIQAANGNDTLNETLKLVQGDTDTGVMLNSFQHPMIIFTQPSINKPQTERF